MEETLLGKVLEVFGDLLEIFQWCTFTPGKRLYRVLQTVVNMVLNKRSLGLADCLFYRVQLLCNIDTGAAAFNHRDDAA